MTAGQRLNALETSPRVNEPEEGKAPDAETARLEADIARTRAEMGETIDALKRKLSPSALAEQAKSVAYDATVGKVGQMVEDAEESFVEAGQSMMHTVRRNPLPAALMSSGFGLRAVRRRTWVRSRSTTSWYPREKGALQTADMALERLGIRLCAERAEPEQALPSSS
jgi:hypothetical protein